MPEFSSVTGLEGVRFAPLKKVNGLYVASKIIEYPYAINAKVNTETSTEKQYADNKLVDIYIKKMEKEKGWRIKEIGYDPYNATRTRSE